MSRPARVAVVTSYFPTREEPYRGHSAYQTLRRITGKAEFHIFCPLPVYPSWSKWALTRFRYQRMDLGYSPPDLAVTYVEYPVLPAVTRPINGETCFRKVWRHVHRFRPDLILNYWLYPDGYAAVRAGNRLGVPVIVCSLGSDLKRLDDPLTRFWTRWLLGRADRILTVSEELRQCALRFGAPPEHTVTIRNGFDEDVFKPGDRSRARAGLGLDAAQRVILYVGSLIPSKGLTELVSAFETLSRRSDQICLAIAGEGPLRGELETRANTVTGGSIRLVGKCTPEQVSQWLTACDVFCLPSYSEGCPNVVIEAVACGRPVVGTRVGGIPELVRDDNGILVPPRDQAALEAALDRALERSWDEAAIRDSYRRSWLEVADETWEICRKLLFPRPQ